MDAAANTFYTLHSRVKLENCRRHFAIVVAVAVIVSVIVLDNVIPVELLVVTVCFIDALLRRNCCSRPGIARDTLRGMVHGRSTRAFSAGGARSRAYRAETGERDRAGAGT